MRGVVRDSGGVGSVADVGMGRPGRRDGAVCVRGLRKWLNKLDDIRGAASCRGRVKEASLVVLSDAGGQGVALRS